jgi:PAT family beta-lactamase induction signal transducer AmpG
MTTTRSRRFRLTMFASLYFVQGAALAYFRNFHKPYLSGFGVDPDVIGLLSSILLVPFILKIFIGMLSDRVNLAGMGHRKPYMVLGLLLAALAFGAAGYVLPDQHFLPFAVLIVLGSFSVTLFDSTTDGLALDTTPRRDQGTVQGVMVGGRALGIIILSLVFGALVPAEGFRVVFLIIAVSMLIPLIWVLRVREPAERDEWQRFQWAAFSALTQPRFLFFAAYAILYSFVSFGIDGLVTLFMSQRFGAPELLIGQYGSLRGLGAVIGAVGGGFLIDRIGRRGSAYGALVAISLGGLLFALTARVEMVLLVGLLWGVAWAFQETIFIALAMDLSDSRIAASMFALMMAFSNIGTAAGEGIATGLTDNLSFAQVFMILAAANVVVIPVLWGLFKVAPQVAARPVEEEESLAPVIVG